ncbi:glycosyltransferase family 4 protein [Anaerocolumna chitinilytica]|uniref:Glycosyl transferase family 1 domain-containing protein n=1 Tax=Anaerocolumna chitinilytica TaxID=1727145 RepID=A0A7M3S9D7_9FIRM|nr:glycosyltransferase family 1 protein [Anaerocolumna chitinilytica]BCK01205.1 hypothetical protein bsdcttw_42450 [Anaerocolumna chitinilytica]
MKVITEVQTVCTPIPTGIPWYTINLVQSLLARRKNEYALTFFDKDKERKNYEKYIEKYFGIYSPQLFETNIYSYKDIMMSNAKTVFETKSYNDYTGAYGDIFHFMLPLWLPERLNGNMVVTVHDLIAVLHPELSLSANNAVNCKIGFELIKRKKPVCIADSQATKNDLCRNSNITEDSVFVVPLACDPNIFFQEKDEETLKALNIRNPFILYAGTVDDPRKGVINLISAFENIADKASDVLLVLAGSHCQRRGWEDIKEKLVKSKYRERIILTDFVTPKQMRNLMSMASIFVFPSEFEGFGLPVLEAMTCGAPVITTNVSSLPEVGGDACVYVSPNNPEQLAFEIERLLNSEMLRNEYINMGFIQAKKFSWDKTAQMTEEVYKYAYDSR